MQLVDDISACGKLGKHLEADCPIPSTNRRVNHHRKYQGLLEHRPSLLWVLGPKDEVVYRIDEAVCSARVPMR